MYKNLKLPNLMVLVLLVLCFPVTSNSYVYDYLEFKEDLRPRLLSYTKDDCQLINKYSHDWKLIQNTADLLILYEGFSSKPYRDTNGNWTQGYGRHVGKNKIPRVSESMARQWLYDDIYEVIVGLDEKIPWWRKCNPVRQQVLINFAYNVGINGLDKFDKFLKAIQTRQYTKASKELLYNGSNKTKYFKQVGVRATHLSYAIRTGKWDKEAIKSYYG